MPEEEQEAKNILKEDKDDIIDESEIKRIIKLYLGRDSTPEEISRFLGMKESELKILTDYVNTERTSQKDQSETEMKGNKVQNDLMLKGMKAVGNNNLEAMKTGQPQMPMPVNIPAPAQMPTQTAPAQPTGGRMIPEGRYSLIQFKG